MKRIIRSIEQALTELYNIEIEHHAEDFLLSPEKGSGRSALLVRNDSDGVSLGIYFGDSTRKELPEGRSPENASEERLGAFSVVAEEISHFHYLIFHSQQGRSLSRLELEIQGNVDAFLVAYFAATADFDPLYDRFFEAFQIKTDLSSDERDRYEEANRIAGGYLKLFRGRLQTQKALSELRDFYRVGLSEKISRTRGG